LECRYVVFELGQQHFCESGGEVLQLVYWCGDVVLDRQLRQCDGPVNGSAASAQGDVAAARMYGRVTLWMASSITLFRADRPLVSLLTRQCTLCKQWTLRRWEV
jgi:hypothetical protein